MDMWAQEAKGVGMHWESSTGIYTRQRVGSCCIAWGLSSMLPEDLEGWDGGGREAQGGGDTCTHRPDSHCGTAETSTTL